MKLASAREIQAPQTLPQLDAVGVDYAQHGGFRRKEVRPVLVRDEEAAQARERGNSE